MRLHLELTPMLSGFYHITDSFGPAPARLGAARVTVLVNVGGEVGA
ncbi:hypothetical protein [Streptomyces sp. BBFR102]